VVIRMPTTIIQPPTALKPARAPESV